ncbi:DJ-1/PfpI family protein [Bacillus solimangrovi]|uniref:AraC family transcriptional regulator n=1 Tax=Bacillus solimangrovi TaxID=1305675 RepID=A0A1E5LI76_9BACI|nr:DJ-1/PfpI family protein [Bacillus solimangrovi]OEH93777.1 AraC family transcriptional regulator [Bacillus solimangrovi]
MNIHIILFDGFDELDAIAPYEVLKRANEITEQFRVSLVSLNDCIEVSGFYGLKVKVDTTVSTNITPDIVIIPGGGWNHRGERGARVEANRGKLPKLIKQFYEQGSIIAGVCTGGMLMAVAGITKGRTATMHHLAAEEMSSFGCEVIGARVVDDQDIITARGVTSGVDLALWLIERFSGADVALAVEKRLEYERRGTVWNRPTKSH